MQEMNFAEAQIQSSDAVMDMNMGHWEGCPRSIGNLLPGCFPSTGGRVYLDGCFIRATNYSFYREIITDGDMKVSFISNISLFN